ncbi:hypothetical protein K488DRAFT_74552 [Vararia minispora EC-137]|uniref:Uncharacterized protein n=1 Tax=Vararia minispora EC-137 TaxID=1314806 RepID=A0ACB8Q899_9AGAM|nr:hypothetical protein K488DRAFT_74552 [Vararia minispora EC-137]
MISGIPNLSDLGTSGNGEGSLDVASATSALSVLDAASLHPCEQRTRIQHKRHYAYESTLTLHLSTIQSIGGANRISSLTAAITGGVGPQRLGTATNDTTIGTGDDNVSSVQPRTPSIRRSLGVTIIESFLQQAPATEGIQREKPMYSTGTVSVPWIVVLLSKTLDVAKRQKINSCLHHSTSLELGIRQNTASRPQTNPSSRP